MSEVNLAKIKDYACEDADVVYQLYDKLFQKLKENSLLELFNNIEIPFVQVLIELESKGLYVDIEMLDNLSANISPL